jgi:hypothetical protein
LFQERLDLDQPKTAGLVDIEHSTTIWFWLEPVRHDVCRPEDETKEHSASEAVTLKTKETRGK